METKQDVMDAISNHLKISHFQCSTGSTEPKEFLLAITEQMGITNLTLGLDKIDLAKLIVESSGKKWLPSYDSSGGTITKEGMIAIQESIFGLI